jgi:hypothetical protein
VLREVAGGRRRTQEDAGRRCLPAGLGASDEPRGDARVDEEAPLSSVAGTTPGRGGTTTRQRPGEVRSAACDVISTVTASSWALLPPA